MCSSLRIKYLNIEGNVIISEETYEHTDEEENTQNSKLANLNFAIDFTNTNSYTYQDNQGNTVSYNLNLEVLSL